MGIRTVEAAGFSNRHTLVALEHGCTLCRLGSIGVAGTGRNLEDRDVGFEKTELLRL